MKLLCIHENPNPRGAIMSIEVYEDRKIRNWRDRGMADPWPVLMRKDFSTLTDEEWTKNPFDTKR